MRFPDENLVTPIYVKTSDDMSWPDEKVFYILSSSGLYLCRNFPFFRSSVPARIWPSELATQGKFLDPHYPKVPRTLLEMAVRFFGEVGERFGAEAALLLVWDDKEEEVRLLTPKQRCTVYRGWLGGMIAVGVHYAPPAHLPEGWTVFGDIHSHVDGPAFSSFTDKEDEKYRPGLHIVVGRVQEEPPEFHVEATVDGVRFKVDMEKVVEGYNQRSEQVPPKWFHKLDIESYESYWDYVRANPKSRDYNWGAETGYKQR